MINLLNKFNALKLDKLDNKKIFFIILVCLFIFYIDFTFFMKLQLQGIRTLTPKIVELKKEINNVAKDLSRLQDLERKADKDKTQMAAPKFKEVICEDKTLLLLQEVSNLANKNKVKIMQINTSKDAKIQDEVIAGERLLPIIITLDLICDYHSLCSFINALENTRYFIELQDMKITRDSHNYILQDVNLILKTYARK